MYWVSYPNTNAEQPPPARPTSYENLTEAKLVLRLVRPYLGKKYTMVITLYKAQETLIRALLLQHGILEDADPKTGLRICSVDQSQGSEADVVILSCVRSNPERRSGFVTNPNRLNVAVSRARERLVVVGDANTLGRDKNWKALHKKC
ncbi:AAA domain-containing protein, partial [Ochromonadaceae sp. CCMP2298]